MFPGIYDFHWDAGHIIFLGIFYTVLTIVVSTMVIALLRAVRDVRSEHVDAVRWHTDFEDLPERWRRCRHELAGEVVNRTCPNAFDCRHCSEHPRFMAQRSLHPLPLSEPLAGGFAVPDDRLYHRGHTWVRVSPDGLLTVGLDDLGAHLLGKPDDLHVPQRGTRLIANGTAWTAVKDGVRIRVLSPVDGEVVESEGLTLKVKGEGSLAHLLSPEEARPWMLREVERLHLAVGSSLPDGGTPVDDLSSAIPKDLRDDVYGMMFLNA